MLFSDIRTLPRTMHLYPDSPSELYKWEQKENSTDYARSHNKVLSVDIEDRTFKGQKVIECIGFAFSPFSALVVPFWSELRAHHNYWQITEDEIEAWNFVEHMLSSYPIMGQNYMAYDTWVMLREMNLKTKDFAEDTMIQHHGFQPEMQKGLGVLASIYCNVPAYKTFKPRGKRATKRDE